MRRFLTALALMLFALSAFSFNVDIPQQVPAYSNWFFSVEFESEDFDKFNVLIGDETALTLFTSGMGKPAISENERIISSNYFDNVLYISMQGFAKGEKEITLETIRDGSQKEEQIFEVEFFEPISEEQSSDFFSEMNYIYNLVDRLSEHVEELDPFVREKNSKLDELESKISELETQLSEANAKIKMLEIKSEEEKTEPVAMEEKEEEGEFPMAPSGFVGFDSGAILSGAVVIILILVAGFLIVRRESWGLGERPLFGDAFSGKDGQIDDEDFEEVSKSKKWSVEDDSGEEPPSSGDLIKRERP